MKKSRALFIAAGIPILYLLLQFAVNSAVSVFYMVRAMTENRNITDTDDFMELYERILTDTVSATVPIMIIASGVFLLILMLTYSKKPYSVWQAAGLKRDAGGNAVMWSVLAGFFFNVMCAGLISAMPVPEAWDASHEAVTDALLGGNIMLSVLYTVLIAPFVEELVFRGFTHRYLMKIMPVWAAALVSGVFFGIFHFNYLQTIYAFAMGVFLALVYSWFKNLWVCAAFHIAFNGANFVTAPVIYLIYGDTDTLPFPGACVMAALGAVISVFSVVCLYNSRLNIEPDAAVQD